MVDQNKLFEDLKIWILQLPGVTQATHRFGGTEFQVEGLEFMHHHGPSFLDIRLSKDDQATALRMEQLSLTGSLLKPDGSASGSRNGRISIPPGNSFSSHMITRGPAWKPREPEEPNRDLAKMH